MLDTLEGFKGTVSVGGRKITNLRFADDIDLITGSKEELAELTSRLDTTSGSYGMEISGEKSKVMVTGSRKASNKSNDPVVIKIKVSDNTYEDVKTFQYLGSTINEEVTSDYEIKKRLAIATSQLAKLNKLWNTGGISTTCKMTLIRSLVISIALYGCETWTYNKKMEKRISAFEMRCYRRLLGITWKEKVTNIVIIEKTKSLIGDYEPLLEMTKRRKLQWFGHVTRQPGSMAHTVMHGMVEGTRNRGRPRNTWLSDIKKWTAATGMKWIDVKMQELGVKSNTNYKIAFHLDYEAMISVHTPKHGVVEVKPLGVIWGKYDQYNSTNTIMFDDIRRNFLMNPQNGLRACILFIIRAFRKAHLNRDKDQELLKLAKYLKDIALLSDFSNLDHSQWEKIGFSVTMVFTNVENLRRIH
ncbi:Ubiquitin-like domain-containing CTD phosphatase 1 [Nymphon striatum]|nr:Ubiquitin-like domain-containing CTD phosphatase 1 [Nymphon striatum]